MFVCELFETKHETCRSSVDIYDNSTDRKNCNSIYYNFKKENDHRSTKP